MTYPEKGAGYRHMPKFMDRALAAGRGARPGHRGRIRALCARGAAPPRAHDQPGPVFSGSTARGAAALGPCLRHPVRAGLV